MEHTQPEIATVGKTDLSILKPFDIQKEALQKLADDYKNLVVTEETFEEAKKARAVCRENRLGIEKILKHNKGILNGKKAEQEDKAAELVAIISPTEDKIDSGIKAIEQKKELEKKRKEEEAMKKLSERQSSLSGYEMKYEDGSYTLGDHTITAVQLKVFSDMEFNEFLEEVKAEYQKILDLRQEAEKQKKEEEERLEVQRKEQEAERVRLQEIADQQQAQADLLRKQQEDFQAEQDRIKKENEEAERVRLDAIAKQEEHLRKQKEEHLNAIKKQRSMQLENMGIWYDREIDSFFLTESCKVVDMTEVIKADTEEWEALVKKITPLVKQFNEEEEEKKQAELKAEQDRKDAEKKAQEERKKALQPDKEKLMRLMDQFVNIQFPTCKSPEAIDACNEVARQTDGVKKYIASVVNSL